MHQQLWGYKVEEKLYVGVREQKRLNTAAVEDTVSQRRSLTFLKKQSKNKEELREIWTE
jgi:hypothetical protein